MDILWNRVKHPLTGTDVYNDSSVSGATVKDALNSLKPYANDRIIVVDPQGSDTTGDGSNGRPYQTIAKAMATAIALTPAASTANPVAIVLNPGQYTSQVILQNEGISLYGYGQFISEITRSGNCLTIRDNGVDAEPWDVKVIGISLRNTDPGTYALRIEGVAGSSLAGNEFQFRDGAIVGTKSVYCNLANYITYQNEWIQGAQDYSQTSGIWIEKSQHDGQITDNWDNAGLKPADASHYGINLSSARLALDPIYVNAGFLGDNYRVREPIASKLTNDSSVPGATIKDALDSLVAGTEPDIRNSYTTGEALTKGNVVYFSAAGTVSKALATGATYKASGVASENKGAGLSTPIILNGDVQDTLLVAGLTVLVNDFIYLSDITAGMGTNVAPTAIGSYIVPIGKVIDATGYGVDNTVKILFSPGHIVGL